MSWVNLYFSLYPFFLYRYRVNWPHKHNADFPTLLLRQMFSQADMVMARVIWAQVCVFSCSRHLIVLPVLLLCHILYIIFQPKLLSYWSNQILSFVFDHLLSGFWLDLVQSALFGKWAKQRAETFFFYQLFFSGAHSSILNFLSFLFNDTIVILPWSSRCKFPAISHCEHSLNTSVPVDCQTSSQFTAFEEITSHITIFLYWAVSN